MAIDVLVPFDYGLTLDWYNFPVLLTERDRADLQREIDDEEDHL